MAYKISNESNALISNQFLSSSWFNNNFMVFYVIMNSFHEGTKIRLIKFEIATKRFLLFKNRIETETYAHLTDVQLIFHFHPIENSFYSLFFRFCSILWHYFNRHRFIWIFFFSFYFSILLDVPFFCCSSWTVYKCKRNAHSHIHSVQ